jgi:hypothetical protein
MIVRAAAWLTIPTSDSRRGYKVYNPLALGYNHLSNTETKSITFFDIVNGSATAQKSTLSAEGSTTAMVYTES